MLLYLKKIISQNSYPYNVIEFEDLDLKAPVVFFTGENGSGKSTLLRILSELTHSINVSKDIAYNFENYEGYQVAWSQKLKKGYYFQSEDFYSFLNWVEKEEYENKAMMEASMERHGSTKSMGKLMEIEMHKGNTQRMKKMVSEFKEASHGEGYIRFFASKLRANTLYLLDEPETPLSFQNQLTLLALIDEYVKQGSQFIICTHSPILLAYPNALIYSFNTTIETTEYSKHSIVQDYQMFLNNPDRYLRHLFMEDEVN